MAVVLQKASSEVTLGEKAWVDDRVEMLVSVRPCGVDHPQARSLVAGGFSDHSTGLGCSGLGVDSDAKILSGLALNEGRCLRAAPKWPACRQCAEVFTSMSAFSPLRTSSFPFGKPSLRCLPARVRSFFSPLALF